MIPTRTTLIALALAMVSCRAGQYAMINPFAEEPDATMVAPADDPNGWGSGVPNTSETVYGWDGVPVGGPIQAPEVGHVQVSNAPLGHGLENGSQNQPSRLKMLDLYNQTVKERDDYREQCETQELALQQSARQIEEMQMRYETLQAELERTLTDLSEIQAQNDDLAGRLTTAQIRRLEAEKAWLESAIEWRDKSTANAGMRSAVSEVKE